MDYVGKGLMSSSRRAHLEKLKTHLRKYAEENISEVFALVLNEKVIHYEEQEKVRGLTASMIMFDEIETAPLKQRDYTILRNRNLSRKDELFAPHQDVFSSVKKVNSKYFGSHYAEVIENMLLQDCPESEWADRVSQEIVNTVATPREWVNIRAFYSNKKGK